MWSMYNAKSCEDAAKRIFCSNLAKGRVSWLVANQDAEGQSCLGSRDQPGYGIHTHEQASTHSSPGPLD